MAQRYEYQDIDGHVILLFVHPANLHKRKQNKNKEAGETKKMTSNTVGSHPLYALRGSNPGPID